MTKQTKYIFVVGGVISGVGKGITTSSIGLILQNRGLTVTAIKIDPYINVDAGTMNPTEHGEVFVLTDGDVLEIDEQEARLGERVPASYVYVDGLGIGDVDQQILRDRAHLSTDGVVVVIVAVDRQTGKLTRPAEVLSRGFVDVEEREELLEQSRAVVAQSLNGAAHIAEFGDINTRIRDGLSKFLYDETRRRPMVLTVTVEV